MKASKYSGAIFNISLFIYGSMASVKDIFEITCKKTFSKVMSPLHVNANGQVQTGKLLEVSSAGIVRLAATTEVLWGMSICKFLQAMEKSSDVAF